MLQINNLTYRIGARVLLDQASATINDGHRVGLVGRNGTGKTTLFRLIAGQLASDGGSIELPQRVDMGITTQEAPNGDESLIDTVIHADKELASLNAEALTATDPERIAAIHARLQDKHAHTATARAARILAGLGFDAEAQNRPCRSFSGGWRMRVALAGLLFTQPELLLLDEPTNHLDLEATLWLEEYLKRYPGTILLISHDRDLLNRVPTEILHLENSKLTLYRGGYDRFEATRQMQIEQNEKARVKQVARRAEIQSFVDRFRAKATKAKQAQSRLKMLERMKPIAEHQEEGSFRFTFPEPEALPPPLYTLDRVTLGYNGKPVLSNISLRLDEDDRIALLGANGNGKSTFMKLLAGRLAPMAGEVNKSGKLRVGYFAQHQAEELDLTVTPITQLSRKRPGVPEREIRSHLGAFAFSQARAETVIGSLSGGEKARLLFALMTVEKPHILLLDEPTNHLDMDSRQALIEAINAFPGAVVIVSHDPHILELTVDRFWLIEKGRVQPFDGDLDDYRNRFTEAAPASREKARSDTGADPAADRKRAAERRQQLAPLKKQLQQAETRVTALEKERAKVKESLADPTLYGKGVGRLLDLQKQLGTVEKDLAQAESQWLDLQEKWETAEKAAV